MFFKHNRIFIFYLAPFEYAFVQRFWVGTARLEIISIFKGTREKRTNKTKNSTETQCVPIGVGIFEINDADRSYDSLCFTRRSNFCHNSGFAEWTGSETFGNEPMLPRKELWILQKVKKQCTMNVLSFDYIEKTAESGIEKPICYNFFRKADSKLVSDLKNVLNTTNDNNNSDRYLTIRF